jgi:hypothetical protein
MRYLFVILLLAGCATPKAKISEKIGCPADETRIIDMDPGFGVQNTTWRAACGKVQYSCNAGPYLGKFNWLEDVACKSTPKGAAGYLSQEELTKERKSSFDAFLESLVPPETSKQ